MQKSMYATDAFGAGLTLAIIKRMIRRYWRVLFLLLPMIKWEYIDELEK